MFDVFYLKIKMIISLIKCNKYKKKNIKEFIKI